MSRRHEHELAFTEFFVASTPALRRTAYVVVRDWHVAEDVTQQAMAKLYTAWPRIRAETRTAYARRAVVNEALTHLRGKRPETPAEAPMETLPDRAAGATPDTGLDEALGALPPRQRAIVALRFLDDLPVQEVATVLGIAEGTVKSQTHRALTTLRHILPTLNQEVR